MGEPVANDNRSPVRELLYAPPIARAVNVRLQSSLKSQLTTAREVNVRLLLAQIVLGEKGFGKERGAKSAQGTAHDRSCSLLAVSAADLASNSLSGLKCSPYFKLLLAWKMIANGNHFEEPPLNEQVFICEMRFFTIFGDFPSLESHNKFSDRRAASLTASAVIFAYGVKRKNQFSEAFTKVLFVIRREA